MKIEFDPVKSEKNRRERGLSFDMAAEFEWSDAVIMTDHRKPYDEDRFVTVGYLDRRIHVLCFTPKPEGIRIISLRKANRREAIRYEKALTVDE